jgi:hypothetical protein
VPAPVGNPEGHSRRESELIALGRFMLDAEGFWTCDPQQPKCSCAEGLAAVVQRPAGTVCRICTNWTPHLGCVLGHNRALEKDPGPRTPLDVAIAQAHGWVEVRNFGRAVGRMERYLRNHADDAAAHLALAKLYDHTLYQGPDQRRAVEHYRRFLDLRRGTDDEAEEAQARRRIPILQRLPPSTRKEEETLAAFVCFFRFGMVTRVAYGLITAERLILARVGDADPESGRTAAQMGRPNERNTRLLRCLAEDDPLEHEMTLTKRELDRLALLPPRALANEHCTNVTFVYAQCHEVRLEADPLRNAVVVRFETDHESRELVFPIERKRQAEQCAALLECLSERARGNLHSPPSPAQERAKT